MNTLPADIQALVFDLDDTLYPEIHYVRSGFRTIATRLAAPERDADSIFNLLIQAFETGPRDRVFNNVLRKLGQNDDPQLIAELVRLYRTHRPALQLDNSTRRLLAALKKTYTLGLLTDGYLPAQPLKVEALQLQKYIPHILYTEELGRQFWKPSPVPFEKMTQRLCCLPAQTVYIADNPPKAVLAPLPHGWFPGRHPPPGQLHQNLIPTPDSQPHITISSLTDLPSLLPPC